MSATIPFNKDLQEIAFPVWPCLCNFHNWMHSAEYNRQSNNGVSDLQNQDLIQDTKAHVQFHQKLTGSI